tara:strand:- start:479 stop:700 length:222 start_codon:yes stop_codon:yes gene_type:complete
MPAYDFKCEKCNYEFELQCTISEYDKIKKQSCPKCKNKQIVRIISPIGISFGRGFFKDGYESAKNLTSNSNGE